MNLLLAVGDATAAVDDATAAAGSGMGMLSMIVIYGLFAVAIWFFLFRPQKKEQKKRAAMLAQLETGDCVMTTSGFIGIVIDIANDDTVIVEFGNNKNCRIPMEKSAISRVEKPGEA